MTTATPSRPVAPAREARPRTHAPRLTTHIDPFRVLRRHMLLIIASAVVGLGVGVGAHILFQRFYPLYASQVVFEIRPGVDNVRDIGTQDIFQDTLVLRLGMTEGILLTSRDVLDSALRDRQVRNTNWFRANFVDREGTELVAEAVDELQEDLRTRMVRNTNLFELTWSAHEPSDVPLVLNEIARSYIERRRTLDNLMYSDNISVFRDQLAKTKREIEDLDQRMASFIRTHEMTTLLDQKDSQLAHQMRELAEQITRTSSQLSVAETQYVQVSAKLEGTVEPSPDDRFIAEQNPAVAQHDATMLELKTELRHLYEIYQPEHMAITRLEGRLRATEAEREVKLRNIMVETLQAQLKAIGDQKEQLQTNLQRLEDEYEKRDLQLRELSARHSEYESMRTQRDYLEATRDADLQLIKEVELLKLRADAARVKQAQPAITPREPSFPKLEIVAPLGVLLVVSLTVGLIFLRELTDQRVRSASDLSIVPGASVVGIIPDRADDPTRARDAEMVVRKHPHSVLAESYRQAFATVAKLVDRAGHQSLLLLGGLPGAGTTTVATNLAATFAAAGRKVILIDANFRRPRLAEALGLDGGSAGLGDVLAGAVTAGEAIADLGGGLSALTVGTAPNRVFEMLNTRQFDSVLAQLRDQFDLLIFDSPPAVVAGEAMALANKLDAALLVVRAGQEHRGLVARLIHQVADARCDLLGVLLNRPRGTAGGYFKKNYAAIAAYSNGSAT